MTTDNFPEKLLTYGDVQEITGIKVELLYGKNLKMKMIPFQKPIRLAIILRDGSYPKS